MANLIDLSKEMLIERYCDGVRLIKPESKNVNHFNSDNKNEAISVEKILNLPVNVFFLDPNCLIKNLNETAVKVCGYPSITATINKTVRIAAKKDHADLILRQDREPLLLNQMTIREYHFMRLDDIDFTALAIRYPLYNDLKETLGIFSLSIILGPSSPCTMADAFTQITAAGLLAQSKNLNKLDVLTLGREIDGVYLSKREMDCVKLLAQGNTAKMIARNLKLSPRTVEHYIENVKAKFGISSSIKLVAKITSFINLVS